MKLINQFMYKEPEAGKYVRYVRNKAANSIIVKLVIRWFSVSFCIPKIWIVFHVVE